MLAAKMHKDAPTPYAKKLLKKRPELAQPPSFSNPSIYAAEFGEPPYADAARAENGDPGPSRSEQIALGKRPVIENQSTAMEAFGGPSQADSLRSDGSGSEPSKPKASFSEIEIVSEEPPKPNEIVKRLSKSVSFADDKNIAVKHELLNDDEGFSDRGIKQVRPEAKLAGKKLHDLVAQDPGGFNLEKAIKKVIEETEGVSEREEWDVTGHFETLQAMAIDEAIEKLVAVVPNSVDQAEQLLKTLTQKIDSEGETERQKTLPQKIDSGGETKRQNKGSFFQRFTQRKRPKETSEGKRHKETSEGSSTQAQTPEQQQLESALRKIAPNRRQDVIADYEDTAIAKQAMWNALLDDSD